jgi:succinoglycan biosynthesis transport protein ExoP
VHGTNGFDVIEFVDYLRDKGSVFLVSCGVAVALAVGVSLVMPKSYTAKASVVIDAPAGSDPRAVLSLSSIYLESLRTYESFALSDTLFQQAVARMGVDGSKANVVKVSMPANTTVLEIRATLRDPRKAQALAQYIAEQTVARGNSADSKTAEETIAGLRSKQQDALDRLTHVRRESDASLASAPIAALENEVRGGFDQKFRLEGDLARARTDLAEYATQPENDATRRQSAATRVRIASIEKQKQELAAELEKKGARLDASRSRRDAMDAEVQTAQTAYEDATTRLNNTLSAPQLRGQRLRLIDPGIVPQQPAFPNLWLNTGAAFFASLIGTFGVLMLRFGYVRLQRERSERVYSLV